jgi:lipoprotein-anchoring transpeptidase ErfK/SrfK
MSDGMRMGETRVRRWGPATGMVAAFALVWPLGGGLADPPTPPVPDPVVRAFVAPSHVGPPGARSLPSSADPDRHSPERRRPAARAAPPRLLVEITHDTPMTARPGTGRVVGVLPAGSKYYGTPTVAWVQELSSDGHFGRLAVPYAAASRSGWIRLDGLRRHSTHVIVTADLSRHLVTVERRGERVTSFRAATGASTSPTPRGRYFVTDRVPFSTGSYLGHFAFGISGIQPRLPAGWTGGNQLAIHGTSAPSTIGQSASAGCLRVSAGALERLKPLLRLGTPVIIRR